MTQSESCDGVLAAQGVGLFARVLSARIETRIELWQSPTSLLICESSGWGFVYARRELVTDGRWHELGAGTSVRATLSKTTGDVTIETAMHRGILVEFFSLMRRVQLGYVRDFFIYADANDTTTSTTPSASAVWVWTRDETQDERRAALEAEAVALNSAGARAFSATQFSATATETGLEAAPLVQHKLPTTLALSPASLSSLSHVNAAPNFTGTWDVDTATSLDTLEEILNLMGLPWLAVKVALSLTVTTAIGHDAGANTFTTEERTSIGVIAKSVLRTDGTCVAHVGADGRTALITCTARAATEAEAAARVPVLGALRIITQLPDGLGTLDNTWFLQVGGSKMFQKIIFTRGDKTLIAHRVLVNRDKPVEQRPSVANTSVSATS